MNLPPFSFVRHSIDSLSQAVKQRLRQWIRPDNHALVLNAAVDLMRSKSELMLENALLRQQLIVLQRQVKRPALTWRDRTVMVLLAAANRFYAPDKIVVPLDPSLGPPALGDFAYPAEPAAIYACHDQKCSLPVTDPSDLADCVNWLMTGSEGE